MNQYTCIDDFLGHASYFDEALNFIHKIFIKIQYESIYILLEHMVDDSHLPYLDWFIFYKKTVMGWTISFLLPTNVSAPFWDIFRDSFSIIKYYF